MWLFDTNPPPDQAQAFGELVSPDPQAPMTGGRARTRRGARQKKPPQQPSEAKIQAQLTASLIVFRLGRPDSLPDERALKYAIEREILTGYFNTDYFLECELLDTTYLSDEPDSVPDPAPRPYGYRIAGNLPTVPTYHNGLTAAGPSRYQGFLTGEYFHDHLLVWSRRLFNLPTLSPDGRIEPAWHKFEGQLTINTDARGSRPMCSVLMKFRLTNQGENPLQYDDSPTFEPLSFYWRFKPPLGTAPYYHVTQPVRLINNAGDQRNLATAGPINRLLVLAAPRPMLGYGQNNCSSIDTALTGDSKIYQLDP